MLDYILLWLAESVAGMLVMVIFLLVGAMLMGGYACYKKMIGEE